MKIDLDNSTAFYRPYFLKKEKSMSTKNQICVCLDAEHDMRYYNLIKDWEANDAFSCQFVRTYDLNSQAGYQSDELIKQKVRQRMINSSALLVIIGEDTRNLFKYIRFELEYAIMHNIPIIGVNTNGHRKIDQNCPPILKNQLAVYVPFSLRSIGKALTNWPKTHREYIRKNMKGPYHYADFVYEYH